MDSSLDTTLPVLDAIGRDVERRLSSSAPTPTSLSDLADAALNTEVHTIPWIVEALNASASLSAAAEQQGMVMQGDPHAPVSRLSTAELHALDDHFIQHYTSSSLLDDDSQDATALAIDEALDAAEAEELVGHALARDFNVEDASRVFAHLDETIFMPDPMATASNIVARPIQFASVSGESVSPNLAALFPIHMLAAVLGMFQLPANLPGAWATITLMVHQLFGHLNLLIEGLTAVLKCPICLQVLQRPYIMECGHIACEHCLHEYYRSILNAHVIIYPNYVSRHRHLVMQIYCFYNSTILNDDRRILRACILSTLSSLVRPTYECPIWRAVISRPPIFAYTIADVVDIALMLGVQAPEEVFNVVQHREWRDFFIVMG